MKLPLIAAIAIVWVSCKKESTVQIITGKKYYIKSGIFNPGAYRPVNPVRVDSLYIDGATQLPYAKCTALVDWNTFALDTKGGISPQIVAGNKATLSAGVQYLDSKPHVWSIPQWDIGDEAK